MDDDTFDPARFLEAQDAIYSDVVSELRDGHKQTHWMWFIFPQVAGLGWSEVSRYYAIANLSQATAYAADPVLGTRLRECVAIINGLRGQTAHEIFGSPDDVKLGSSMTLFALAVPTEPLFREALAKYFEGRLDPLTVAKVGTP